MCECVCKQDLDHTGFCTRLLATAAADRAVCLPYALPPSPKKPAQVMMPTWQACSHQTPSSSCWLPAPRPPVRPACGPSHRWGGAMTAAGADAAGALQPAAALLGAVGSFAACCSAAVKAVSAMLTHPWWLGGVSLYQTECLLIIMTSLHRFACSLVLCCAVPPGPAPHARGHGAAQQQAGGSRRRLAAAAGGGRGWRQRWRGRGGARCVCAGMPGCGALRWAPVSHAVLRPRPRLGGQLSRGGSSSGRRSSSSSC